MEFPSVEKKLTSYMLYNQEKEIKRIADGLHDGVAQNLYSIYTGLQHIQNFQENEELVQYTAKMIELTEKTLNDLRKLSTNLYPQTLDTFGLYAAIKSFVQHQEERVGFTISIKANGEEQRLALEKERAIFRASKDMFQFLMQCPKVKSIHIMVNWLYKEIQIDMQAFSQNCGWQSGEAENELSIAAVSKQVELLEGSFVHSLSSGDGLLLSLKVPVE